jgi:hypothetical protein
MRVDEQLGHYAYEKFTEHLYDAMEFALDGHLTPTQILNCCQEACDTILHDRKRRTNEAFNQLHRKLQEPTAWPEKN